MDTFHSSKDAAPSEPAEEAGTSPSRWLNLGVLAHVDAGKTSLTEAFLELGGAISQRGRVDDGTTQTDGLAVERRRGITVRAAVATFHVGDVGINIVDTPGHPDFIAEVDRSLAVLDGAVLVVSAIEGVQAQTIVLHRALRRLGVPTIVFLNKIDRLGADTDRTIHQVRRRLGMAVVALNAIADPGGPNVNAGPTVLRLDPEVVCSELAACDDALLEDWLQDGAPSMKRLWRSLRSMTCNGVVLPVLSGSARTTAGVDQLIEAVLELFPTSGGATGNPVAGQVFKVERTNQRTRICSVRLRAGTLSVRDHVTVGAGHRGTVTAIEVHRPGGTVAATRATAGQVARVEGLEQARIGDWIGSRPNGVLEPTFAPPAMQVTITARDPGRQNDLFRALGELAEIDPLIGLKTDHAELHLSLYGAVQQEVIAETLSTDYGIEVVFDHPSVICIERPAGRSKAVLRIGEPDHFDMVTLGLTVEPREPGAGVSLLVTAERSTLPLHLYGTVEGFRAAVLGYLEEPLSNGPKGWPVTDIQITVTESGYPTAGPQAAEVRRTTGRVVGQALARAGTLVCEPVDRIRVEFPTESMSAVLNLLGRHKAIPEAPIVVGEVAVVGGTLRTISVEAVRRALDGVTQGQGVLDRHLDHYIPVRAPEGQRG